jgi:hypothetical protein
MVNSQGATHYQRPISRIGSNLTYASFLNPAKKTYAAPNAAIIVDEDNNNLYAQAGRLSGSCGRASISVFIYVFILRPLPTISLLIGVSYNLLCVYRVG